MKLHNLYLAVIAIAIALCFDISSTLAQASSDTVNWLFNQANQSSKKNPTSYRIEKGKIFSTSNKGITWDVVQISSEALLIAWDTEHSEHVVAATRNGIYLSIDGGHVWQMRLWRPTRFLAERLEFVTGAAQEVLLVGTMNFPNGGRQQQHWRSMDGGVTWLQANITQTLQGVVMKSNVAQVDTSCGVVWGSIEKLSPDDPNPSGGNYVPHIAVQGDTIHVVWELSPYRLPYIRSTNDGLSWEQPRDLLLDTTISPCIAGWQRIIVESQNVYIFFVFGYCVPGPETRPVYFIKSSDWGTTWSLPIKASSDSSGAIFSASVRADTMTVVYVPDVNGQVQYPLITRSINGGASWTRSLQTMPSSSSNQLRLVLSPGLLNFSHPGDRWPGPAPEIVLHRTTDLADTWKDSSVLSTQDGEGSDYPFIKASDNVLGATTLAIVWRDAKYGGAAFSASVLARLSYDNGKYWGLEYRLNDEPFGFQMRVALQNNIVASAWTQEGSEPQPYRVQARISTDCGVNWGSVCEIIPSPSYAGVPSIAISNSAIHVAWEEYKDSLWNVYYRRGKLQQITPFISSTFLDFDTVTVGCNRSEVVKVKNLRCDPLHLNALISNTEDFSADPDNLFILPQDSAVLNVRFAPLSVGDKSAQMIFMHNQSNVPDTILLSANAGGIGSEIAFTDSFGIGWQLISVPLESVCPYILYGSFLYQGSYRSADTLLIGRGYWNKLKKPSLSFAGITVTQDTIPITIRWNLIGSISNPVPVVSISSNPPGIITSQFFGYDGIYFASDSIYPGKAYWVKVNQDGELILSSTSATPSARINIVPTSELPPLPPDGVVASSERTTPKTFMLAQNYPNPFNPVTTIRFDVPVSGFVSLKIFDVLGREVATLVNKQLSPGAYTSNWDASRFNSGVYFYRLQAKDFIETKKLLLIK